MKYKRISNLTIIVFNCFCYYTFLNAIVIPSLINNFDKEAFLYPIMFIPIGIIILGLFKYKIILKDIINSYIKRYTMLIYFVLTSLLLVYISTYILKYFFYPKTSEMIFYFVYFITATYIARFGIRSILNTSTIFLLVIAFIVVIPFIFAEKTINPELVLPINLTHSIWPLIFLLIIPLDMLTIYIFENETKEKKIKKRVLLIPFIFTMVLVSLNIYASTVHFSIGFLKEINLPGFIIYDSVKISKNFDNYDIVIVYSCSIATIFKVAYNMNFIRLLLKTKKTNKSFLYLALVLTLILVINNYINYDFFKIIDPILIVLLSLISFITFLLLIRRDNYVS